LKTAAMDVPQTRYARSKEGNVAYQIVGDGPRDLVFIPWWATNVEIMWEEPTMARFLNRLASFSRLLCFDKRGAGVSDPVPLAALPTLEQWSDDVRTVMEAAGSQRAGLLGFAHGGQMAMLFAATYPAQTSALILLDSFARQFGDDDQPSSFSFGRMPLSLDEIEELWGTGAGLDVFAPRAAQDERFRRWYARYERLSLSPRMLRAVVASDFEKDLRGVLPAIRVPTLVLHRAGNRFIDIRRGRYLAEHIAGAKFVEIPGDDHLFHLGETEIILNEIEEFLTGERPVPEIDRVLATVLFTDIVGSTERAAVLGDHAWRSLLDAHHDVARRALERHRGREVEFVGDGLLATFDGPARAILLRLRDRRGRARARHRNPRRPAHGRDRARGACRARHRRAHRCARGSAGGPERSPGLEHGEGLGGGLGAPLRRLRRARSQGCSRRVEALPRGATRGLNV
jgi:pimeloyl-ACP methyl ester carboxylesterase